jgi:cytochrome P450
MESKTSYDTEVAACPHVRPFTLTPPVDRPLDEPDYFEELRRECPVSTVAVGPEMTATLFTTYDDVKAILFDARFSSNPLTPGFPAFGTPGSDNPAALNTMLRSDPPVHGELRRTIAKDFIPRAVEGYRDFIRSTVDARLAGLRSLPQPVDLIENFALAVPSGVISKILGVPAEDEPLFHELTERMDTLSATREEQYRALDDFAEYAFSLIALKEREPGDDLISRLTSDALHTGALTRDQLAGMILLLVAGGHDSTAGMIGLSILTLLKFPEQLELLRRGERSWENAVEELLRVHSVARIGPRRAATEDIQVGDTLVRRGEGVIASILSANHDERYFGPAGIDNFAIPESRPKHLAFGFGPHQCTGQTLARLEMLYALERIFDTFPGMRLAGEDLDPVGYRDDRAFFGLNRLVVYL